MIFDTHTHLNVEEFAGHEAEEIALAAEMGVTQMNIVGLINRRLSVPWSW
ncbi:putative deoxyribonuclease YcfH [Streptococcus mitis]|uniref:Putative deoxyribonuclease YcfH n=1 Tax=Streptococcus mitis TaxID=28037 RepID=A0A150NXT2_STRMT|nr:putative deoxyribonuclease YcfH [Streptococcus mitis]